MQASLYYQLQQVEQPDFAVAPDDPIDLQLASAMAWISELKSGKDDLERKLVHTTRKVELKGQLLRNAETREQELQIQLSEYGGRRASFIERINQTCDQAFPVSTDIDAISCMGRMRNVFKSYASSFATWAKASEVRRLASGFFKASYRQLLRQHFPSLYRADECPVQKL